jgi:hypothetical protein
MRIAICDYAGHAYAVQLSRELAGRGHSVRHLHFTEFQTPKGELSRHPLDPETLDITPVSLGRPFEKYSLLARRSHEIEIGRRIAACILKFSPEVVLANLPLVALGEALAACRSANTPFVLWQQDIYSRAIREALGRKLGIAGRALGFYIGAWKRARWLQAPQSSSSRRTSSAPSRMSSGSAPAMFT